MSAERDAVTAEVDGTTQAGISRRLLLAAAAAGTAAAVAPPTVAQAAKRRSTRRPKGRRYRELDARIERAMKQLGIPGAAVGLIHGGRQYVRGYGVTNTEYPQPVDADTLFRIGSTTKTFTGTALMQLVQAGRVRLDAPVRRYLPGFSVADRAASRKVTVRNLVQHCPGWVGDDIQDFGGGTDAIRRYVTSMTRLPQQAPPGELFAYNDSALVLTGRIIEVVTGRPYETVIADDVLAPLALAHTGFFTDQMIGMKFAASHVVANGRILPDPEIWPVPRSINPTGGLISSVSDQLRWARFHMGDGRAPGGGRRLLARRALKAMQSNPGPGGTLLDELEGMGITWMLRPTAEGDRIVQHGGNWPGQSSGFMMVPSRGFAITLLTNSTGGPTLTGSLFGDDWLLRTFAGVSNPPSVPQRRGAAELAPYEGRYRASNILPDGSWNHTEVTLTAKDGRLAVDGPIAAAAFAFYRDDYLVDLDATGASDGGRSNFVRGADGSIAWLRTHGRLLKRQG
jgi:CubicO group peptidase (beta-lactamase class C family)